MREYVLFRDGHKCQCGKGKSKDSKLHVHHIESRKTGGDAPNNLITLCSECHAKYHRGEIALPKTVRRGTSLRDASVMGIMRKALYCRLMKEIDGEIPCFETFGYITKNTRISYGLPKEHVIDARCISGNPTALSTGNYYIIRKLRVNNRQLHRATILKGGTRKSNQAPYEVNGFRLYDSVRFNGLSYFIKARRQRGEFSLCDIYGHLLTDSARYNKISLLNHNKSNLLVMVN